MEKSVLELFCEINGMEVADTVEDDILGLDIEGVADIWILDVEDNGIEIFAEIDGIDATNPVAMKALLEANYLGMATGAARVALDPFTGKLSLCERWTVEQLLGEDAQDNLITFARQVATWRTEAVGMFAEHVKASGAAPEFIDDRLKL